MTPDPSPACARRARSLRPLRTEAAAEELAEHRVVRELHSGRRRRRFLLDPHGDDCRRGGLDDVGVRPWCGGIEPGTRRRVGDDVGRRGCDAGRALALTDAVAGGADQRQDGDAGACPGQLTTRRNVEHDGSISFSARNLRTSLRMNQWRTEYGSTGRSSASLPAAHTSLTQPSLSGPLPDHYIGARLAGEAAEPRPAKHVRSFELQLA